MSKKRRQIADEYFAKLRQDPDYLKMREEKERRLREWKAEYCKQEISVIQRLATIGYSADSLSSFVRQYAPLPLNAVEVLLDYLKDINFKILQESIIRALAVARNRFDGQILTQIYDAASDDEGLRFAIFNTIALTHPRGISSWILKFKENKYQRGKLEGLGIDWTYYDHEQYDSPS